MRYLHNGQIKLHDYRAFGGSSFDSVHISTLYRDEQPYMLAGELARVFSSSDRYEAKPLTGLTLGAGNYEVIDGSRYTWRLVGDDEFFLYGTEVVTTQTKPGLGLQTFQIALTEGFCHEPDVLMCEDENMPLLEIVGNPQKTGTGSWVYSVRIQTDDPTMFFPLSLLGPGKRFRKVSTSIADEMNPIWGTTQMQTGFTLESQIGYFGNEISVTDREIKKEIQSGKAGRNTSGYAYNIVARDKNGKLKEIPRGMFFTHMEGELIERTMNDREYAMRYGRKSNRKDVSGRYNKSTGPGFNQLVQDGQILYHSGNLTVQELDDYFNGYFFHKVDSNGRDITIDTGTLGFRMFHQMLLTYYKDVFAFNGSDTKDLFISNTEGINGNRGLSVGGQFLELQLPMGTRVRLMQNPHKDDPKNGRPHPDNPNYTTLSSRMDIYDFGGANTENGVKSNMRMIVDSNSEYYAYSSALVDPKKGFVRDGSKVSSLEKGVHAIYEFSGGLHVHDTSRIGSIMEEPEDYM